MSWSKRILTAVALLVVASLALAAPMAGADHEDVITEKIAVDEATFTLELIAEDLGTSVGAVAAPYVTDRLFLAEQTGAIKAISLDDPTVAPHTVLDVGGLLVRLKTTGFDERGLIGLAFDPHYRKTGRFYTYTSEPLGPTPDFTTLGADERRDEEGSLSVIREWHVDDPRRAEATADPGSSRVLLRIEQPQLNHNGGALVFGRDAMLYVALGDGGGRDDEGPGHGPDQQGNGQDLSEGNLLGKILRIDPLSTTSANGAYGIPEDNPFVGRAGADEIYAYGFRNPYRMAFDQATGDLIAGDVGQRDIEEVDLIFPGGNYGWPVKEGTFLFNNNGLAARGFSGDPSPGEPVGMVDPIAQYDHDEGTSVTAGYVYRGAALEALQGSYIFGDLTIDGDLIAGRFFRLSPAGALTEIIPTNHGDNRMLITGFARDTQGELYVVGLRPQTGFPAGVLYKLVPDP